MTLTDQKNLVLIHKELAVVLKRQPSYQCKQCKLLARQLASVTTLYSDILEGVIRKEIKQSYAKRILAIIMEAIKSFTKVG